LLEIFGLPLSRLMECLQFHHHCAHLKDFVSIEKIKLGTMALEVEAMTLLVLMASTTSRIMGIPMKFKF